MILNDIEYLEARDDAGDGTPVLFLHGIGGSAQSFEDQLSNLPGFHCIAWNMPGYGESLSNEWPPSFESLSTTLSAFIDSLGFHQVHLVGQSIGGMLALEHALRCPEQVISLTMIASTPSFGGRDEQFKIDFLKARLAPLDAGKSMQQIAAQAAPMLVGPAASDECIDRVEAILSQVSERTWRGILETLITFNRRDELAEVEHPCCLIAGSYDKNSPARTMQKMSEKLLHAEFHLIDGAGHMINQEAAELTNNILGQFLGKHPQ